jgi:t-SNARE complex subunit (syntaxin)
VNELEIQFVSETAKQDQARKEGREPEPEAQQPISAQTQAFLERKAEHDLEFGKAQEEMLDGVKRLNQLAQGIGNELDAQELMITDIDKQMDKVNDKFKVSNKQLKKLVRDTGGTSRWCVLLFLFVILIALVGYMFNLITF